MPLEVAVEVESVTDRVVTGAGAFDDCLRLVFTVRPRDTEYAPTFTARVFTGQTSAWFAPGVGLVKLAQRDQNQQVRLVYLDDCCVPGGSGYFPTVAGARWRYTWLRDWARLLFDDVVICRGEDEGMAHFTSSACVLVPDDNRVRGYWREAVAHERQGTDTRTLSDALGKLICVLADHDPDELSARKHELATVCSKSANEWDAHHAAATFGDLESGTEATPQQVYDRRLKALDLARRLGDRPKEAWCLASLGDDCRKLDRPDEAQAFMEQAGELFAELGDAWLSSLWQSHAERVRQAAASAGAVPQPSFRTGFWSIRQIDGQLRSEASSRKVYDPPLSSEEEGSPVKDFPASGIGFALPTLSSPVGEEQHHGAKSGVSVPGAGSGRTRG